MGAWIDANPGVAVTLFGMIVTGIIYIVRMEVVMGRLDQRVLSCEKRADEDREDIKKQLSTIGSTVSDVKTSVDQIVGALHGRRATDVLHRHHEEHL